MHAALFLHVLRDGERRRRVDGRPGESCFGHSVATRPVPEQERLRGQRRSGLPERLRTGSRGPLTVARTRYSGRRDGVPSPRAQ
jgi:hypothetical protein